MNVLKSSFGHSGSKNKSLRNTSFSNKRIPSNAGLHEWKKVTFFSSLKMFLELSGVWEVLAHLT